MALQSLKSNAWIQWRQTKFQASLNMEKTKKYVPTYFILFTCHLSFSVVPNHCPFQRTAACYHQHGRRHRYGNENKLRFTSALIWFVQPVKRLFIFTSATNNCIILSTTLSSFVPTFPPVKQSSAATHTVDITLLLMWITDTLLQVQLWQWTEWEGRGVREIGVFDGTFTAPPGRPAPSQGNT